MTSACLSTAYLAPVSYYKTLCNRDHIIVEKCCNYVKQTYRNRCNIISANGLIPLSVPVIKPDTAKCLTRDIRISDHDNWQHMHWNAIVSAYGSSPFFEYYQDDIIPFFEKKLSGTFLFDLNESLRETICRLLEITPNVVYSDEYVDYTGSETDDFRDVIKDFICNRIIRSFHRSWVLYPMPAFSICCLIWDLSLNLCFMIGYNCRNKM